MYPRPQPVQVEGVEVQVRQLEVQAAQTEETDT
jgi:hypothetical protein